jgi:hypothetical protein
MKWVYLIAEIQGASVEFVKKVEAEEVIQNNKNKGIRPEYIQPQSWLRNRQIRWRFS